MEEWKIIEETDGDYLVSSLGRIKKANGLIINPILQRNGYLHVGLWKHQQCKQRCIHRLVAQAFIPNPDNLPQVNHKDGNTKNNCVSNLEWITAKGNQQHRIHVLHKDMFGEHNPMYGKLGVNSPVFKDFILMLDKDKKIVKKFATTIEASRYFNGVTKNNRGSSHIGAILNHKGRNKNYKGYSFIYEKEYLEQVDLKPCELLENP